MKRCTKCKQEKPLIDFSRNYGTTDGYQYWCKVCLNRACGIASAKRRAANRARHLAAEAERKNQDG